MEELNLQVQKIERTLIAFPDTGFSLRVVVNLGRVDNRKSYNPGVRKFSYTNNRVLNLEKSTNVYVDTSDYLVFSYKENYKDKAKEIFLSYPSLFRLKQFLSDICELFEYTDKIFRELEDGNLVKNSEYVGEEFKITDLSRLSGKSSMAGTIDVVEDESGGNHVSAILFLGDRDVIVILTKDNMLALKDYVERFDLGNTALQLIGISRQF